MFKEIYSQFENSYKLENLSPGCTVLAQRPQQPTNQSSATAGITDSG